MTFNSLNFILIFLPLCYAGFLLVHRGFGWKGVYGYLAIMSLVFYAQFSFVLCLILIGSIVFNFCAGRLIIGMENRRQARMLTTFAVVSNLLALGYFKYVNFFIDIGNDVGGFGFDHINILLPIGVSFFTFTQIGFLIECSAGSVRPVNLGRYALFAGFFPCVTAGPLLLQREIFDQMEDREDPAFSTSRVAIGLTIFSMGLAKKVIIADALAPYADVVFDGASAGLALSSGVAWIGAICYTMQLYFDFSGYTDMAIGIAFLFGFRLPLNFNSPFKAQSISEFWNRWHMTMTRFFTTFLFTPMAIRNSRHAAQAGYGHFRKWLSVGALPAFYTFVVAGIWHGAGWTFVVFGLIHGSALAVNHGWREWRLPAPPPLFGWALTMLIVVAGMVMFRAPDLGTAADILSAMIGFPQGDLAMTANVVAFEHRMAITYIGLCMMIVLLAPSSHEVMRNFWASCDRKPANMADGGGITAWIPNAAWAAALALLFVISMTSIEDGSNFLYYSF